jgi:cytochrome oxidase Cu insertion factor (SCO1/SenC/PrrC family)
LPGMGTGLNSNDPTVVSAFHAQLFKQGLIVVVIFALVALAWNFLRGDQLRRALGDVDGKSVVMQATEGAHLVGGEPVALAEPAGRRLLRISFGLLWIFDGVLQGQQSMPLGMAPQVIKPAAATSPVWVQHLLNAAATVWSYHPIAVPAAALWIQIGIGVWLLVAPRGRWSRVAGMASVVWGLTVWVLGEAFGQIFAPGLSWLFGAPGPVLFYCMAGILVALPERLWSTPLLGRTTLRILGVFFVGMAVLQAWPGRGFWRGGQPGNGTGNLTAMVREMAQTPQPRFLSSWVASFAAFDAAHGWAVNLFVVLALFGSGTCLLSASPRVMRPALLFAAAICVADWVLVQDLGFMGGVGTDPNSMIPLVVVLGGSYLAVVQLPVASAQRSRVAAEGSRTETGASTALGVAGASSSDARPAGLLGAWRLWVPKEPTYLLRSVAAVGAVGVTLVGVVPMAVAAAQPHADPILSQAVDGTPQAIDAPAASFNLVDQHGSAVSLGSLRGRAVALTFLDPVCTSDCPIIAQEFRAADAILGDDARRVDLVAVDANPRYTSAQYLDAFDQQEGLARTPNWLYLTGSLPQLERMWNTYGAEISLAPAGAMVAHSEFAYVIDPRGRTRFFLNTDPGPATQATRSSFSVTLSNALKSALGRR